MPSVAAIRSSRRGFESPGVIVGRLPLIRRAGAGEWSRKLVAVRGELSGTTVKLIAWLALAVCSGCSPSAVDRQEASRAFKAQAEEAGRAMVAGDYAKSADLMHPSLVKRAGGRDGMIAVLDLAAQNLKA